MGVLLASVAATCPAMPGCAAEAPAAQDVQVKDIRALIDRYFLSWSAQDMQRYGRCFHPKAVVQLVDPKAGLVSTALGPFLRGQAESHRRSAHRMTETAENVEIRREGDLARVLVAWKLVDGERIETGYDHFTLLKVADEWRIAHLIFYATPAARVGASGDGKSSSP